MIRRIRMLMRKEFLELLQSPRLLGLIFVAPMLQLGMLGYAVTTDVKNVPIVIVDGDRSSASRLILERFSASSSFRVVGEVYRPADVDEYLKQGRAALAIVIPIGLQDAIEGRRSPITQTIQILADGSDSNSSGIALAYAIGLIGDVNRTLAIERGLPPGGLDARVRVWYNPELESRDFMLPGVLALLLLVITSNLSSMAIVRERGVGTLEQLNVTPLGRWELILGKLLPYGVIGLIDVLLVLAVVLLWFEIPLRGSVWLLLGGCLVYVLCTLGLGLFVSTISATQQQAMMTATFFFLMPMVYLSGFIFPIENMPTVIQWVTLLIPLRYFLVIVRGIFLRGVDFSVLWPQFAALAVWGVTVLTLAAVRSRKRA